MAERRRFMIAGEAVSCASEAVKRLETAEVDSLIVANRVKSPDTAVNPSSSISTGPA